MPGHRKTGAGAVRLITAGVDLRNRCPNLISSTLSPTRFALVAQWIERLSPEQKAEGSIPFEGTNDKTRTSSGAGLVFSSHPRFRTQVRAEAPSGGRLTRESTLPFGSMLPLDSKAARPRPDTNWHRTSTGRATPMDLQGEHRAERGHRRRGRAHRRRAGKRGGGRGPGPGGAPPARGCLAPRLNRRRPRPHLAKRVGPRPAGLVRLGQQAPATAAWCGHRAGRP